MKRILIADDHQLFLAGLKLVFAENKEYKIAAELNSGSDVIKMFKKSHFDVAILDINMPGENGLKVCKWIKENYPECAVIILTMYSDAQFINEFLQSEASAYVLKNAGKTEILNAIKFAEQGQKYISKELLPTTEKCDSELSKINTLTRRELDIIKLLVSGKNSQQIAEDLYLSVFTVNTHRKNILHKLNLKNAAGIVKFAIENNIQ